MKIRFFALPHPAGCRGRRARAARRADRGGTSRDSRRRRATWCGPRESSTAHLVSTLVTDADVRGVIATESALSRSTGRTASLIRWVVLVDARHRGTADNPHRRRDRVSRRARRRGDGRRRLALHRIAPGVRVEPVVRARASRDTLPCRGGPRRSPPRVPALITLGGRRAAAKARCGPRWYSLMRIAGLALTISARPACRRRCARSRWSTSTGACDSREPRGGHRDRNRRPRGLREVVSSRCSSARRFRSSRPSYVGPEPLRWCSSDGASVAWTHRGVPLLRTSRRFAPLRVTATVDPPRLDVASTPAFERALASRERSDARGRALADRADHRADSCW